MRRWSLVLVGLVAITAAGCSGSTSTGPSGQVTPPTVDVFTGSLAPGGFIVHPFTIARSNGTLDVTLTQVSASLEIGLGVGTPADGTCTFLSGASIRRGASTTPQLSGVTNAGSYCIGIFDVGTLTEAVTYRVTASHY